MADYTKIPSSAKVKPTPFTANIPDEKLQQMLQLIKISPIGPAVFENVDTSRTYGMNRDWLIKAKDEWSNKFDWRAYEKRINSFPNYKIEVTDDDGTKWDMHFLALFSNNENAIPLGFFHGWPGSFLEFLDMLDLIKNKYTPDTLPYHIIVPSLPGYTFSSGPPTNKDASRIEMSRVCGKLMHALGFEKGYLAQGGDLGSFVSRQLAQDDDACKGFHLNMAIVPPPENANELPIDGLEKKQQQKGKTWIDTGTAYGQEHGTRTATIGLVLSSSPVAMLAWIGEKFLEWSDADPPVDKILESIYGPERQAIQEKCKPKKPNTKPMGFSWFPGELVPTPISWVATSGNLVHSNRHSSGGHFAAMEKPAELFADVEDWVKVAWK
ncbi:hypothetical protein B9Z65_6903 [Elsinoe australis]|uniref:Epoxide hydrolase N-terminal domain-containing protein n=1 Tax=Elsinoe australis TaxID=40998 RepID=A0A2P7Z415_9PEZI|nr:hypothetical protein B9Z65_6903 [Elsinoe australis]